MTFSWKVAKAKAVINAINRNKTMAKTSINPEFKLKHPDWCRDAQSKNYIQLVKVVTEEITKRQKETEVRDKKIAGN